MPTNWGESIIEDKIARGILKAEEIANPEIRKELVDDYNARYRTIFIRDATAALRAQRIDATTFEKYIRAGDLDTAMLVLQRDLGDLAAIKLRRAVVAEVCGRRS